MASSRFLALLAALVLVCGSAGGLDNGLGATPPMGFNTWNHFGCARAFCRSWPTQVRCQRAGCKPTDGPCLHDSCNVSERVVTDAAQALVELGLKSVGACACACARRDDKRLLRSLAESTSVAQLARSQVTRWWRWTTAGASARFTLRRKSR